MIIGIDASNIRFGGGITHLRELLAGVDRDVCSFDRVIVWGGKKTLDQLPDKEWLVKQHIPLLDGNLLKRLFWQKKLLTKYAKKSCDILFVPGANYSGSYRPYVSMSQNLLPFDYKERARFGFSWTHLRYRLLELSQKKSFINANGVIFLTNTAQNVVESSTGKLPVASSIVPHGVLSVFLQKPREQKDISEYTKDNPFKLLYVSNINYYKHQWVVIEAISRLRERGVPVSLDLVGPAYTSALSKLNDSIQKFDPDGDFVNFKGSVSYSSLPDIYKNSDAFVFASSCENLPNILLEAMASGLPIACSDSGPMPEVLGECGVYFNPEDAKQIEKSLYKLISDKKLRKKYAELAYNESLKYNWPRCAEQTFSFISEVYNEVR